MLEELTRAMQEIESLQSDLRDARNWDAQQERLLEKIENKYEQLKAKHGEESDESEQSDESEDANESKIALEGEKVKLKLENENIRLENHVLKPMVELEEWKKKGLESELQRRGKDIAMES